MRYRRIRAGVNSDHIFAIFLRDINNGIAGWFALRLIKRKGVYVRTGQMIGR